MHGAHSSTLHQKQQHRCCINVFQNLSYRYDSTGEVYHHSILHNRYRNVQVSFPPARVFPFGNADNACVSGYKARTCRIQRYTLRDFGRQRNNHGDSTREGRGSTCWLKLCTWCCRAVVTCAALLWPRSSAPASYSFRCVYMCTAADSRAFLCTFSPFFSTRALRPRLCAAVHTCGCCIMPCHGS